ncbi:MAG TPA: GNAT family N-acetyltransferase [Ktedonobacteraceae bacterium]|nr:GNAT family N-acetyltransferase [Ktedonobacteraceae bacterium]
MHITIRPAIVPQDYMAIARVLTAEMPLWPTMAQNLAYEDAVRDPKLRHTVFVAEVEAGDVEVPLYEDMGEDERAMVGVGTIGHDVFAPREDRFKLDIRVHPQMQGRGVGKQLYDALMLHVEPLGVREITTEVWAAHPRAVRFVTDRDFGEVWRRIDWSLEVADFAFAPYASLEESVRAMGIEIKTYEELADDPQRLRKLYELNKALWLDIPYGEPVMMTQRSQEQFEQTEVRVAKFLPDACFIAIHDGQYVGYSSLTRTGEYYDTDMTGVLPAYRGKGIATMLKLSGIRYAQAHDNRAIMTMNDSVNTAMMALNRKLGFLQVGTIIRFAKRLNR